MADAIIARRFGKSSSSSGNARFITELIIKNTNWVMPNDIKNNNIDVKIFGGGGGYGRDADGRYNYGGGGGYYAPGGNNSGGEEAMEEEAMVD